MLICLEYSDPLEEGLNKEEFNMEIASIKGDNVLFLYHPAEATADVGQQFTILEVPDQTEGLVVQVISNDSLEYAGLQQELIQQILEQQATVQRILDREEGMGEIKNLKLATAKIRKRIRAGNWASWDGWIPTRHVNVQRVDADSLLRNVMPQPRVPLRNFVSFDGTPLAIEGPRLNMVNVIAGVKGSGKSHTTKHLVLALAGQNVPCIVFDINGEYTTLPDVIVLEWGQNFRPSLAQVGYEMLNLVVRAVYPLPENSQNVLESTLPIAFARRREYCQQHNQPFSINLEQLRRYTWNNNAYVQDAIVDRLRVVDNLNLFSDPVTQPNANLVTDFNPIYENSCNGHPIIFNMRGMNATLQQALVKAMNKTIEDLCEIEAANHQRFPFVFYEEAHFYINTDAILNIITRGRHIGMASVFVTNTPQNLPDTVFRQLDNLFLLNLSHKDDIRNVSKNSFTDPETIESFATRMPERHALIVGNVTDRYPLVVGVDPLPDNVPPSGRTRSTWDRF
jgi:uncharacterized protein